MAISSDAPPAAGEPAAPTNGVSSKKAASAAATPSEDAVNPTDFDGAVRTNNKPPSRDTLKRIADLPVLDRDGKTHPFHSLYAQPGRTLVIFVRHFFCGVS